MDEELVNTVDVITYLCHNHKFWLGYSLLINERSSVSVQNYHGMPPDSKVHVATMGPIWDLSAPDGPHVGPTDLAIRAVLAVGIEENGIAIGIELKKKMELTLSLVIMKTNCDLRWIQPKEKIPYSSMGFESNYNSLHSKMYLDMSL